MTPPSIIREITLDEDAWLLRKTTGMCSGRKERLTRPTKKFRKLVFAKDLRAV